MSTNINDMLEQRKQLYGSYEQGVATQAALMDALAKHYADVHGRAMPTELVVELNFIALKLVRAVTSPEYADNWRDISGYAALAMAARNAEPAAPQLSNDEYTRLYTIMDQLRTSLCAFRDTLKVQNDVDEADRLAAASNSAIAALIEIATSK